MGSELSKGVCCKSSGAGKNAIDGETGGGLCSGCWCCYAPVLAGLQDANGKPIVLDEEFEPLEDEDENVPDTAPLVKTKPSKCDLQRKPTIKKQPKKALKEQQ
ncbi:myristylated tegument protein [Elephant endotheliotropic herpesvirus 2]|nr:myristylated tegument protein [Elephant endotheliotropic herpesvirus 2]UEH20538.1 myristylated tegument protein [Elephant endotheliotropic herpesvirus 2]